jgi:hypothetical protein
MFDNNAITVAADAGPFIIEQDCILRGVFLSTNIGIPLGTADLIIYDGSINSANVIVNIPMITGQSSVFNTTSSHTFHFGDKMIVDLSLTLTGSQTGLRSFQVNVGLF